MRRTFAVLTIAVASLSAVACSAGGGVEEVAAPQGAAASAGDAEATEASAPEAARARDSRAVGELQAAAPVADDGDGRDVDEALDAFAAAPVGERIIKDGTVVLEVADGAFDEGFQRVVDTAQRLGGTVVSSRTDATEADEPSGAVTVRVPVDAYERLLAGIADIGTVRSRRITSEDVSAEYVDLRARLRQQQAQERFYRGLLDEADGVEDAIAVQQQLQVVQTEIERLTGRLQFLDARTAFSTLTVRLFEPGAGLPAEPPADEPSLARAWETARDAFVTVVGAMVVTVVGAAPLLLPLGLAVLAWRALRRRPSDAVMRAE